MKEEAIAKQKQEDRLKEEAIARQQEEVKIKEKKKMIMVNKKRK